MSDNVNSAFVHLHLHSEFSLLDGGNRIGNLVERVKELGMNAVALTDHGNLHGAANFYRACKAAEIKPILGCELYVALGDRRDRTYTGLSDGGDHLVTLCETQQGWQNLMRINSDAYLKGYYYRPRTDKEMLEAHCDGLITINGHLGSSIARLLTTYDKTQSDADWQKVLDEASWHKKTFGVNAAGDPCFYLELQRIGEEDQEKINPYIIKLSKDLDIPLVCDNDAHFMSRDDHDAHDTLICISMGKIKNDPKRLHYSPELHVKGPEEMAELFHDVPEAVLNSGRIAERCHTELDFETNHAPVVRVITESAREILNTPREQWGKAWASYESEYETGSTRWFDTFCQQFKVLPFDEENDVETTEELKELCDRALRELTEAGAVWRYGPDGVTDEIRARMDRELKVLADKLISAYFIIVWDFVIEARVRGIPVNARGSGVGTMVGYCLGLSNACPVKYGLLFERFTDPDRTEYPDIDIDICQDGRSDIIDFVWSKYGHVAQIITFGTLGAKAVLKDVGRVLDVPLDEVNKITKLMPDGLKVSLDSALEDPDFKKEYDENYNAKQMVDVGKRLEGMARHTSVHAAGVVLATQPLDNIVPLCKDTKADESIPITQWDGPTCEAVGLLKMDFLGLRTLSIIERAKKLVRDTLDVQVQRDTILGKHGAGPVPDSPREMGIGIPAEANPNLLSTFDPMDTERLTFKDQNVLDLFRRGDTKGVFQFESDGMRGLLMAMAPDRLEDLIAANALYRPGPMALIPDYNDRKHGRAEVPPVHEIVDKLTDETFGIMIYQEQVMQIVHFLGGIPLRQAYTLIKAISKKKEKVINSNRALFIEGAGEKGLPKAEAEHLFDLILKFAGYGFNKSHSTGYAIVAYQTAFLKTYFPVHYMAALLTYESVNAEKVTEYVAECKKAIFPDGHTGIDVRPPDINMSFRAFSVVYDPDEIPGPNSGHIRFGLGAVKGVGDKSVDGIIAERRENGPFSSLFDFCERVPGNVANKSTIEALIKCGAFDRLHGTEKRSAMVAGLESAISRGAQEASLRGSEDFLFGGVVEESKAQEKEEPQLPNVEPWSPSETLLQEKATLGFYVSAHPLDEHEKTLRRYSNVEVAQIEELRPDIDVTIGVRIMGVRPILMKRGRNAGKKMAILQMEDLTGTVDGVAFADSYSKYAHLIEAESVVFIKGKVKRDREEPSIVIDKVIPLDEAVQSLTRSVTIVVREQKEDGTLRQWNGEFNHLRTMLRQLSGSIPVYFEVHSEQRIVTMNCSGVSVRVDNKFSGHIDAVLQQRDSVKLTGPSRLISQSTRDEVMLGEDDERVTGHGKRYVQAEEEHCASIDRY